MKDVIHTHARTLERKANAAAMQDGFDAAEGILRELATAHPAFRDILPAATAGIEEIIANVRAYCERRKAAIASQAETRVQLERVQRDNADLKEQHARTEAVVMANQQLQEMNEAKMAEMRASLDAAQQVRRRSHAAARDATRRASGKLT